MGLLQPDTRVSVALTAATLAADAALTAAALAVAAAAALAAEDAALAARAAVSTARLQGGRWRRLPWQYVRHHHRPPVRGMDKPHGMDALNHAEILPVQRSG